MPLIVTAGDITAALQRTDAAVDNIDRAVDGCPTLDAITRDQWKTWCHAYRLFSAANKNLSFFTFGLPAIGDQAVAYEHEIGSWNQTIAGKCANPQPSPVPHDEIAARNADAMAKGLGLPAPGSGALLLAGGGLVLALALLLRR